MVSERTCDETRLLLVGFGTDGERVFEADGAGGGGAAPIADDMIAVPTADEAIETVADRPVDCLVTADELPDGTGIDVLETVREREPDLPIVLAPADGDEALASDAIAAGVTEYVPRDQGPEALASAADRALERGRDRRRQRSRARQLDAIFADPETHSWVLDPDGRIRRANESALSAIGAAADEVRGRRFWAVPWWDFPGREDSRSAIRDAVERAADGTVTHRELTHVGPGGEDDPHAFEVSVRPVRDESGAVVSLLAQATDVTERVRLEEELRESEELHRVTLNNMTDTVLITNDAGEFTYVCPNVHFIFGYTDDEIHEMGTIDELLESDLFDRERLAEAGVLTNIECAATDKAGREHTLLVNVREVSIQGGTLLYSCRDITKRKRREEALTALHRTARELLYAETEREIADRIVDDATDALVLPASAAFLVDTDENVLRPAATSPAMDRLHGPLSTRRANAETIAGRVFVEGERQFFGDIRDAPALSDPTTDVRSAGFVPLGDHGVFVAGSPALDAFDDVTREVTDLLAATAEAALDRVARERTLRERDRELKRQNRQLSRLDRMNEIIREIDQALVGAETREEIEGAVCERLTSADRFSFAWIGTPDPANDRLESSAHSGTERGQDYLDTVPLSLAVGDAAGGEPSVATAIDREVTVVSNVVDRLHEDPWREAALARDYQSVVSVPLAYDAFTYGVLTVYADRPDAFDETMCAVLAELGETIASAIAAVERKHALLTDSRTRLEFDVADDGFVFARLAREADARLSFDGGVRQREDGASVFVTVDGVSPDVVTSVAADLVAVERARVISTDGDEESADGGAVLLDLSRPFLALRLADHGVVLRSVDATPDRTRIVVDVPSTVDERSSASIVSNAFSQVDLRSKRTVDRTSARDLRSRLLDRLTDRQLEVVQLAYYGGYFESPRAKSGEDVAETLGISPAAFYRHTRTVQRKLFEVLFEEIGLPANFSQTVE